MTKSFKSKIGHTYISIGFELVQVVPFQCGEFVFEQRFGICSIGISRNSQLLRRFLKQVPYRLVVKSISQCRFCDLARFHTPLPNSQHFCTPSMVMAAKSEKMQIPPLRE